LVDLTYSSELALLELINDDMFKYSSSQLEESTPENYKGLTGEEKEELWSEFEEKINAAKKNLYEEKDGKRIVQAASAWDVMETIHTAFLNDISFIDHCVVNLRQLKEDIISNEQDQILSTALSDILTMYTICVEDNNHDRTRSTPSPEDANLLLEFENMMNNPRIDELDDYLKSAIDFARECPYPRLQGNMIGLFKSRLFEMCMTPNVNTIDMFSKSGSENIKQDNLVLLIQLEETRFRLDNLYRKWGDLFSNGIWEGYKEPLESQKKELDSILTRIGTEEFTESLKKGKIDIINIIKQVALCGPAHLHMAKSYLDLYYRRIQNTIFGRDESINPYKKAQNRLFVVETELATYTKEQMQELGYQHELHEENFGVRTTYTLMNIPPEQVDQGLLKGEKIEVVDFYKDPDSLPSHIRALIEEGKGNLDIQVKRMLETENPPNGYGQLIIPRPVRVTENLVYELPTEKYHEKFSSIEQVLQPGQDSGIHKKIQRLVASNEHCTYLRKNRFDRVARTWKS